MTLEEAKQRIELFSTILLAKMNANGEEFIFIANSGVKHMANG